MLENCKVGETADGDREDENGNEDRKQSGRTQLLVFVVLLIDLLAFTMILPLLPSLLDYYADHDEVHRVSLEYSHRLNSLHR